MGDYDWIGPLVGGVAKGVNSYATADKANSDVQRAYQQMMDNLQARFAEYDQLPAAGYKDVQAQQVGPSALGGIQLDPAGHIAEQEAMAKLSELAANGGLSLADMQALNQIQGNLSQNNTARRKGLANEFSARGQLGSGAQLAMALNSQQNAAQNANQAGESAAAQAQARALDAILRKAGLGRQMESDEYGRKSDAAKAADLIEARNAAARTQAANTNNSIAGQRYDDAFNRVKAKSGLSSQQNDILFGRGTQQARTDAAMGSTTNNLIDSGVGAFGSSGGKSGDGSGGGGGGSSTDMGDGNTDDVDEELPGDD